MAAITLKAIRRDRRQVLITPTAHFLFQMKRFAPWLIDFVNRFSTSRLKRKFLAKSPSKPVPVVVVAPAAETQSNRAA